MLDKPHGSTRSAYWFVLCLSQNHKYIDLKKTPRKNLTLSSLLDFESQRKKRKLWLNNYQIYEIVPPYFVCVYNDQPRVLHDSV